MVKKYYLRAQKLFTMRAKLTFLTLLFAVSSVVAQNESTVYNYYNSKIDEAVLAVNSPVVEDEAGETNPVYARLFTSPVLYKSVVKGAFANEDANDAADSEKLAMDDERAAVIDGVLMGLYREAPGKVHMTEDELRSEKMVAKVNNVVAVAPELKFAKINMPENVVGGMKTTVTKPNYWTTAGRVSLTFTQNFISGNWFQGGESAQAMLAEFDFDINYDDKDRITFKNHFDFDLGFSTSKADTLHSFRTNTDRLRLESTFGYKLIKNLDIAAKLKMETQSLPNYPVNSHDFISNFFAPFDANASVGLNYKPDLGDFKIEFYLAPLSAYNFRFVRFRDLAKDRFGFNEDEVSRRFRQDFGTQLVVTVPTYKLTSFLDVYSRLEYYTNYHRAFFQWETRFSAALSKYFTASLMLHGRFDDSVTLSTDEEVRKWGFWQFKELFTLGVAYSW